MYRRIGTIAITLILIVLLLTPTYIARADTCSVPTLIAAINAANSSGQPTTISLDAGCTYSLTDAAATDPDGYGPAGLPPITGDITIQGNGATIARTGAISFRLFYVTAGGALTLDNLTLSNGLAQGGIGGNAYYDGGGGGAGLGGAIFNRGVLTISGATLIGNVAIGGDGGNDLVDMSHRGGGGGGGMGGPGLDAVNSSGGNGGGVNGGLGGINGAGGSDGGVGGGGGGAGYDGGYGTGGAGGFGGGGGGGMNGGGGGRFGGGGGGQTTLGHPGGAGGFGGGDGGTWAGGGGGGMGGAIFNDGGTVVISNSTLASNTAQGGNGTEGTKSSGAGGSAFGGAIFTYDGVLTTTALVFSSNLVVAGTSFQGRNDPGQAGGPDIYDFALTIMTDGSGTVARSNPGPYRFNDVVQLTAMPATGWSFAGWSGDLMGSANPASITMNGSKTITATFTPNQYMLNVNVAGQGTVAKDPDQATYTYGQVVTLTASAAAGYTFTGWGGDCSGTDPCAVTMDDNQSVSATFTQDHYTLNVNVTGQGTVGKDPDQATYTYGQVVTLTASAAAGYTFTGWGGDCSGTDPCAVTMHDNRSVSATFTQDHYTLNVNVTGQGTVGKDPDQTTYTYGKVVTLTASAALGYTFTGWGGACTGTDPCAVTMDDNQSVSGTFTQDHYTLSMNVTGQGTVGKDPDQATYTYGQVVTLTASAAAGYTFTGWGGDCSGTDPCAVTMHDNRSVSATFTQDHYTLNVNVTGQGTVGKDPDQATYTYGQVVTLTASAAAGYTFTGWGGDCSGTDPCAVTMHDNRSVSATFTQDHYTLNVNVTGQGTVGKDPDQTTYTYGKVVTLTASAAPGYTFTGWGGDCSGTDPCAVTMHDNQSVSATFTQDHYTLNVNVTGQGTVAKDPDQPTYTYGQVVTLTASAAAGYTFTGWAGDCSGTDPCAVTMHDNQSVSATFMQTEYTLTVTPGTGGTATWSPVQATYHLGDRVTLTATATVGYTFTGWTGDYTGSTSSVDITVTGNMAIAASFAQNFTLNTNVDGNGAVGRNPDQASYAPGTMVTLTATPAAGWSFAGWSGDLTGSANPASITLNSSKTITATFTPNQYMLSVDVTGQGTVAKDPDQATYTYGQVVTLTASAALGYTFTGWGGDCSGTDPCAVTMHDNRSVSATFTQDHYTLNVNVTGQGTVGKDPDQTTYTYGKVVTLTASAALGYTFTGWGGACTGTDPCAVTMDDNQSVSGTFTQDHYTLSMNVTGQGTVGKDPDQATYTYGQVVTLTASAAPGYTFTGWGGDCSGTDPCAVTMHDNQSVSATFTQDHYTLNVNVTGQGTVAKDPDQPTYTYGQVVTLTASAAAGYTFTGWAGDCSGTDPCAVTMHDNQSVSATFMQTEYTLTVTPGTGGTATWWPVQATYHLGDRVTLTATATAGYTFTGWTGDYTGSTSPVDITVTGNMTIAVAFTQNFTLNTNVDGNGTVGKNPDQANYAPGTMVTLTATPAAGWSFAGWSGDLTGSINAASISLDSNKTITATFAQNQYTLSINGTGQGTIAKNPDQVTYGAGAVVTLTATPATGWSFVQWSGDLTGSINPASVTLDNSKTITATFAQSQCNLDITVVGQGAVARVPDQPSYTYGQQVTLTPTPAQGWTFSSWGGACTGSGTCVVTMDAKKTVTVTFSAKIAVFIPLVLR